MTKKAVKKAPAKTKRIVAKRTATPTVAKKPLLHDIRGLIEAARQHVAQTANATLTMLYWHVGERIGREVLKERRAEYGERIVVSLSRQLVQEYGKGFGVSALTRMIKFS